MGQEITHSHFRDEDFELFSAHLKHETELLEQWVKDGAFKEVGSQGGFELEAWLLDQDNYPLADNNRFLQQLNDPMAVPELAQFNFELNSLPHKLENRVFDKMYREFSATWDKCRHTADQLGIHLASVGILPSARPADFTLQQMSNMQRYSALNEQVLRLRRGQPLVVDIEGREQLQFNHPDVMLEAAATSFQIHLRMSPTQAVRIYNAGKIIAAPMVAMAANSPYLFGHDLWDETRIPLFEQAVQVGQSDLTRRVSFGIRYAMHSILEVFESNLARYPILLPRVMDEAPETFSHLRLHNGTIWRWNRPLVGFDEDGSPHFRLEHRVVPAGPTMRDSIANAAFFYGLVTAMASAETPPESATPFEWAKNNFYDCARRGLRAEVHWPGSEEKQPVRNLLLETLLPLAAYGLSQLKIDEDEISEWLSIIEKRVQNRQNGAAWQRAWVTRHGKDMRLLTQAYLQRQNSGLPVHEWDFEN